MSHNLKSSVSLFALLFGVTAGFPVYAQDTEMMETVVVTGIRSSLEAAADVKRNSAQVVDSIVAEDIGKMPDPTTAAALQRVPGIQVSVNRNNELGDVRVRGLPDILTTVNGREVFTTTGRGFNLQDIPAESLARLNVFKSQSPDLIEGGLAGAIDLTLQRPFNFNKPRLFISARTNYGERVGRPSTQIGGLITDTMSTSIGDIGVLFSAQVSTNQYFRADTRAWNPRGSNAAPLNTVGYLLPNVTQNWEQAGRLDRMAMNAAVQWQISSSWEAYVEGFYTQTRDYGANIGANAQSFTSKVTLSNIVASDRCFDARATSAGQNPTINTTQAGVESLAAFTVQNLCQVEKVTFNNLALNQTTQARDERRGNRLIAGGLKFDQDGWKADLDISYQSSQAPAENIVADVGQRLADFTYESNVASAPRFTVSDGNALVSSANLSTRNSFQQGFPYGRGDLFATKIDIQKEIGGIIKSIAFGGRYAKRGGDFYSVILNTAWPGGNIGTATEATAILVSKTGLPAEFLALAPKAPGLNNGSRFLSANPDYLLSDEGQDTLRTYVGLPKGIPAYDPARQFNAREETWAGYALAKYEFNLGGDLSVDGLFGGRIARTDRTISTISASATTSDVDFLPNVTARIMLGEGLQSHLSYSQAIRRPNFDNLNPAVTLSPSNNPFVQSVGNAGNPNLRPQKSNSYDATLEYYFQGGYVAFAGYYREITDRVITGTQVEMIGGVGYGISRPRNIGEAKLAGLEFSGQYFLDFLPGALSGIGLQATYTYADSTIGGNDSLAGNPLQGVSKNNFTTGLLYEKYGISGRLVYTYRSKYFDSDETSTISMRPIETVDINRVYVPTLLSYMRPAGRLDFNVGYDITDAIRVYVGGTNVLHNKSKSYYDYGPTTYNYVIWYDDTTYSVGIRFRL